MESKTISMCNTEKHIKDFFLKKAECKACNTKRVLARYYDNEGEITNQRK